MELGGTEKRIQALFSELAVEDHGRVPRFEKLWTQTTRPAPVFRRSLVVAAVVVVVAVTSFALWSRQSQVVLNIAPLEIPTPELASIVESRRPQQQPSRKRIVRPRRTEHLVSSEAALLSRWQSPTQNLMQAPSSVSLNSLPQLNQSAKELESFLPKKESNK